MRDQGRLTSWDDDKGFGFVTPDKGGLRAFVHIRAFSYRRRRPRNGDVITYQITWDKQGRPRAENVLFRDAGGAAETRPESASGTGAYIFCTLFLITVTTLAALGKLPWLVPVVYVVVSLLLFCLYAFDKSAAMNGRWRTSEDVLQGLAMLGGWPGALVAQRMFHHKSKKESFQIGFWGIVIFHLTVLAMIATKFPLVDILRQFHGSS
jgi:uncharacterized membrane protein YsdA (DUF1294 family)/cold shock CspA family protein